MRFTRLHQIAENSRCPPQVILTVLDHYLTPEEALTHFGHQPGGKGFAAFLYNSSRSSSRAGTPSTSAASATPSAGADSTAAVSAQDFALVPSATSLTRELEKARSKRDGPSFLASLARYNAVLARLRADGTIARNVAAMRGVREKVWTKVFHQCYDRAVGPEIEKLKEYEAFSDNVYGELLPRFMNEMCVLLLRWMLFPAATLGTDCRDRIAMQLREDAHEAQ